MNIYAAAQAFVLRNLVTIFSVHILLMIFLLIWNGKALKRPFKGIRIGAVILLLSVLLLAFWLRMHVNNEPNASNNCSWEYKIRAWQMSLDHTKVTPSSGHAQGYPFLLQLFYRLFGASDRTTFLFNVTTGSLTVLLLFALAYLLFRNSAIAIISSFSLSVLPTHISMSGSGEVETVALFFFLLLCSVLYLAAGEDDKSLLMLSALIFSFLVNIRLEFIGLFPFMAAAYFLMAKKRSLRAACMATILFALFVTPTLFYVIFPSPLKNVAAINNSLGFDKTTLSDSLFPGSLIFYLKVLYESILNPVILFFFLFGFLHFRRSKKGILYLVILMVFDILMYGLFAPIYSQRYPTMTMMMAPFLLVMVSKGIHDLTGALVGRMRILLLRQAASIALLVVLALCLFLPRLGTISEEGSDVKDLIFLSKNYDQQYYFLYCDSAVIIFEFPGRFYNVDRNVSETNRSFLYFKTRQESAIPNCPLFKFLKNYNLKLIDGYGEIEVYNLTKKPNPQSHAGPVVIASETHIFQSLNPFNNWRVG